MSIKKYSSFEDASKDLWVMNPDDKYYKKLKSYFEFWGKLSKKKVKKGVIKFKTYKEFLKNKN